MRMLRHRHGESLTLPGPPEAPEQVHVFDQREIDAVHAACILRPRIREDELALELLRARSGPACGEPFGGTVVAFANSALRRALSRHVGQRGALVDVEACEAGPAKLHDTI